MLRSADAEGSGKGGGGSGGETGERGQRGLRELGQIRPSRSLSIALKRV